MGFLDFLFKKKNKRVEKRSQSTTDQNTPNPHTESRSSPEGYLGDLEKTAQVETLLNMPEEERNKEWLAALYLAAEEASFKCISPQVIQGPDGFPYVKLELPVQGETFQCYVIKHMKDDFLLEQGFGVAILGNKNKPLWVFSYGDILNYHLHGSFGAVNAIFTEKRHDEETTGSENINAGEPSEQILPACARNVIANFLKQRYEAPMVALLAHADEGNYELAFNCTPAKFSDMETFREVLQEIGWFLPRYYSYCAVDDDTSGMCLLEKTE